MFLRATPSVTISGLIFNSTPTNLDPIEVAMNLAVILVVLVDRLLVRTKEMRGVLDQTKRSAIGSRLQHVRPHYR